MKKIILIIIISGYTISGFPQNSFNENNGLKNSFQEDNFQPEAKIYPNPCKQDKLTIEFNNEEISEVRITNIAGKEILIKKFQIPENKKEIQLNEVPNGIYLLRVKTTGDKSVVKKLIVTKD
jgi:Secretion system C-terminal sorting domain